MLLNCVCIEYIRSKLIDQYGERHELGKWAQDVKLDLIYYIECNSNQWLSCPKPSHFPAEIIVMLKKREIMQT